VDKTDQQIQQLWNTGNQESALKLLMATYQKRLYAHARSMTGEHESAADVLQDSFVKAWKGLDNFRWDSALYTWLHRIVSNRCLDIIKQRKRGDLVSLDQSIIELESDSAGPSASEINSRLQAALATLPPKQRLVFDMRYRENLKYAAISEVTGTSISALKGSYHEAVKKIEVFLKSDRTF